MSPIVIYVVFDAGVIQATPLISANKFSNASPSTSRGDIVFLSINTWSKLEDFLCILQDID